LLPAIPAPERLTVNNDSLLPPAQHGGSITLRETSLPKGFRETKPNELTDPTGTLYPFWEALRQVRIGFRKDTVRVVHIGDSHIRGHIFPQTTAALLAAAFGKVNYRDMGVNGAFTVGFTAPERISAIAALHPDLIIISFGTNESHNRRYNSMTHYRHLTELTTLLRDSVPQALLLLTTPPGSYERKGTRRRRTYQVNARADAVTRTILRFADAYGLPVWDMYDIVGGVRRASVNWWNEKLMRPDHIHYLPAGYELQGKLLYDALIKAYNRYVEP
jgi:lysophospholipase L1-like esterase